MTSTEVSWAGGSIPDNQTGTFVAAMRLVGNQGDTVYLPTVQGCAQGEDAWIDKTTDPEADNAAPRVVLTQTVAASETTTTASGATSTDDTSIEAANAAKDAQTVKDSENSPIGAVVVVIVVLIIVGGAVVLYLRNRRPRAS